jgi:methylglyoxal synthase
LSPKRYIALIAHNARKEEMAALSQRFAAFLCTQSLIATHTTGTLVASRTGLTVETVLSGPVGGDLQIGALVAMQQVQAVLFLRDPMTAHPHEPDIVALMKVCDIHNVPLATNVATAELLLNQLSLREKEPDRETSPASPAEGAKESALDAA